MYESRELFFLPVSLGEAIDKLTILDIKLDKIKDSRREDVKKEFDLLYDKLDKHIIKYSYLYETMKKVNTIIWDMMDILRDGETEESVYLKICKECIEYNDIRFRIKNKINYISKSYLNEQKSYKKNRIFIKINDEIGEIKEFIEPIKYYSFIYDEIVIFSNNYDLKKEFLYDPTIIFYSDEGDTPSETLEEYKKKYYFLEKNYTKEDINKVFTLCNIINFKV
jgi:hypothetical protein